ncbi:DUF4870 domain-containing protein [Saccharophagus degradans]|uniref:DUF4870 domain-containing protein n=1 Tax=Saccharophagus degradans TaxID=86304 RepID=A0AAW7X555_9GAMM|nr:DUF4870 domain-containing protein [Saccharophagus degradans]MDO6422684.1 DUF4870 domain-containing protein [Saccharophagus degradans]MDO6609621.1 DUF4870 domain-containing protein [Saccharophagus degradans]
MSELPTPSNSEFKPWGMEENVFIMLMHLSQLTGFIIPFGGLILPIVMWATNKDQSENINKHGKVVLNWVISSTIYCVVAFMLIALVIGVPLLIGLCITSLVFIVIGAIKANNGELWPYPISIKFFKV